MSVSTAPIRVTPLQAIGFGPQKLGKHLISTDYQTSKNKPNAPVPIAPVNLTRTARGAIADHLVGPPPSFEVNILEVEADISYAIRQAEATRDSVRNSGAVSPKIRAE